MAFGTTAWDIDYSMYSASGKGQGWSRAWPLSVFPIGGIKRANAISQNYLFLTGL